MSYKGWDARTPRRNEWYWGPIVKSQRLSGLSQKKFCEQEGISYASFKNWSSRLKEGSAKLEDLDEEIGSFVPAVITHDLSYSRDLSESPQDVGSPVNKEGWNFTTVKNDLKGEHPSAVTESLPPLSKPAPLCLRELGIRFDRGLRGNGCTIVVPQGFDELTLHRLLKVVGCEDV